MGDNVVDKKQTGKLVSQGCGSLESKTEADKCGLEDSHLNQLRGRSNRELEVIFAKDPDEDGDLLSQIKDKRKELDDLIKKWKDSRNPKAVTDLTDTAHDEDNTIKKHKKELPTRSSGIVEVMETLEKQHELSNVEETENTCMQSALDIVNEKQGQEKIVDAVCTSESESETSSVEDVTALDRPDEDVVEVKKSSVSNDALQEVDETTLSTDSTAEAVEAKMSSFSTDALQESQTTLGADATAVVVEDKNSSVSPIQNAVSTVDTTEEGQEDIHQKDAELHVDSPDNEEMPEMEKQDSSEESRVNMDVDEPVAGPSGLPVEWQGATVVRNCDKKYCAALM